MDVVLNDGFRQTNQIKMAAAKSFNSLSFEVFGKVQGKFKYLIAFDSFEWNPKFVFDWRCFFNFTFFISEPSVVQFVNT